MEQDWLHFKFKFSTPYILLPLSSRATFRARVRELSPVLKAGVSMDHSREVPEEGPRCQGKARGARRRPEVPGETKAPLSWEENSLFHGEIFKNGFITLNF